MPGGRLTHEDRRDIAAGLAQGLGYAEIARRLARPTSTISREVTRNGGPGRYRADRAHRATEQRARQRKPPRTPALPAAAGDHGRDPAAVHDLQARLTELFVTMGLPRMESRVLVGLYTTDNGSLTATELVQQLRVSPASISKAVAYLERLEMIRRERDAEHRRERYVVDDDLWIRQWLSNARTHAALAAAALGGADVLGSSTPAGGRLRAMSGLFHYLSHDLVHAAEDWWHEFLTTRPPDS